MRCIALTEIDGRSNDFEYSNKIGKQRNCILIFWTPVNDFKKFLICKHALEEEHDYFIEIQDLLLAK